MEVLVSASFNLFAIVVLCKT